MFIIAALIWPSYEAIGIVGGDFNPAVFQHQVKKNGSIDDSWLVSQLFWSTYNESLVLIKTRLVQTNWGITHSRCPGPNVLLCIGFLVGHVAMLPIFAEMDNSSSSGMVNSFCHCLSSFSGKNTTCAVYIINAVFYRVPMAAWAHGFLKIKHTFLKNLFRWHENLAAGREGPINFSQVSYFIGHPVWHATAGAWVYYGAEAIVLFNLRLRMMSAFHMP